MTKVMRTERERLEDVAEFAFSFDCELGVIGERVITLNDISSTLVKLRMDMDNLKNLQTQYSEFHRTVRLLSDLMIHTTNNLTEEYKKVQDVNEGLFEVAVRESLKNEQEKTPVTAMTEA